jgi:enoyl-CoA hydratase/carnithine racemase
MFARGRSNYFNEPLISAIASTLEALANEGNARVVVLAGAGPHFCAGVDFGAAGRDSAASDMQPDRPHLYDSAVKLFRQPLPIVAAIQGAAVGGGLGLAMACDFRIASPDARFSAPFARLGLHHGFGLTVTLPLVLGHQSALDLLYTGRRIKGEEALALGLVDRLTEEGGALAGALAFAREIALSAPIAVRAIRATMRGILADAVQAATDREKALQAVHSQTADMREGVRADLERRMPHFEGR